MVVRTLPEAELFVDARARLAEGPVWDARSGRLVWVDIEGMALHSTHPADGRDRRRCPCRCRSGSPYRGSRAGSWPLWRTASTRSTPTAGRS